MMRQRRVHHVGGMENASTGAAAEAARASPVELHALISTQSAAVGAGGMEHAVTAVELMGSPKMCPQTEPDVKRSNVMSIFTPLAVVADAGTENATSADAGTTTACVGLRQTQHALTSISRVLADRPPTPSERSRRRVDATSAIRLGH